MENSYDIAVIGGGILGLATARALNERAPRARRRPRRRRSSPPTNREQLGRDPSGIYYKPGSYKAKLCVEGKGLMLEFCQKHGSAVDHVGKVNRRNGAGRVAAPASALRARNCQRVPSR